MAGTANRQPGTAHRRSDTAHRKSDTAHRRPAASRLRAIRLVVLDVDGVLSDGRVILGENGGEYRSFDVRDGYGIRKAAAFGLTFALISGKDTKVVDHRARELGIIDVHQGVKDKLEVFRGLLAAHRIAPSEVCCMGDDEPDLPMLAAAGFSAAPPGAVARVRKAVDYVTRAEGGRGAVREVVDLILAAGAGARHRGRAAGAAAGTAARKKVKRG